ncbi:class I SAM-dependent methyltransferase [Paenibacillus sp. FSL H7-0331]|uniref:class I SAM-dependent methyltransferase n=1 Tax=Paenibacillus sp. FSL H7-0331 TaxID=1920421 RepID=UPI00096DB2B5|nr:class I SAM-dependent methyltransferase [Paenibacillus sp. FSL H7-0331]OMF18414.1 SAM-dependent methyltransferase [Paenibacillus sp. FSL H7-0331]
MNKRIERIRNEERKYHEACYDNYQLFEEGSWLHKPVKTVMDTLSYFDSNDKLTVLDLGCGVGRNSIPIAETLKTRSGKVVCVDLMQAALNKLLRYSHKYGVSDYMETYLSDIGECNIPDKKYDYIIAVSALEHVESELKFTQVLDKMVRGTKDRGINCIIMNTNIQEIDISTSTELEPLIELNMSTDQSKELLARAFEDWEVIYTTVKSLAFNIERNGREILLKGDCITYVVQRR